MLKIRLQMTGRRNDRHFRIIVVEHTAGPKSGKYVEKIGFINPRTHEMQIDLDRAKYWLSVGAQPSDRIYNILVDKGVLEGPKRNVLPKKTPIVKEGEESAESEAAEESNAEDAGESQDAEENQEAEPAEAEESKEEEAA